jgi:lipopolysaccharide exporter
MFLHHALKLSGATAAAQMISYASMPILTRLFGVDDYALLGLFFSWMLPLVVISTLRIEFSIPDSSTHDVSLYRRDFALKVSFIMSLLVLAALVILALLDVEFNPVYWFLPAGIVVTAWSQIYNFFTTRTAEFILNSWCRIIGNLFISGISLIIGYYFHHRFGLVIGFILGQFISLLVIIFFSKDRLGLKNLFRLVVNKNEIWKFDKYILYNTPNGLIEVLSLSVIMFFLQDSFGAVITGSFYLCFRILQAPSSLISNTIFLSQFANAAEMNREGKPFHHMVMNTFLLLLGAAIPFMLLIMFFGENIFEMVFGDDWTQAGNLASLLILYFVLIFAVTPFNYVPLIKGKQRQQLIFSFLDLLLRCGAFYGAAQKGNPELAILLFSIIGSFFCLGYIIWYYQLASQNNAANPMNEI